MKELLGWSLNGALDPWSCLDEFYGLFCLVKVFCGIIFQICYFNDFVDECYGLFGLNIAFCRIIF